MAASPPSSAPATLTFRWFEGGSQVDAGPSPALQFTHSTHPLKFVATDPGGLSGTDDATIKIVDTPPPVIGALTVSCAARLPLVPCAWLNDAAGFA